MGVIYGALAGVSRRSQSIRLKWETIARLKVGVIYFTLGNSVLGHQVDIDLCEALRGIFSLIKCNVKQNRLAMQTIGQISLKDTRRFIVNPLGI